MIEMLAKKLSSRIFVKFISFFIFGIFCIYQFNFNSIICIAIVLFVVFGVISFFLIKHKFYYSGLVLLFCLISFMAGAFYLNHYDKHTQLELKSKIGEKLWIYGTVTSSPEFSESEYYYSVDIETDAYEIKGQTGSLNGKMKLFVKNWQKRYPTINDNVFFYTQLSKPVNESNDFDYVSYLKTKNIYATGFSNVLYLSEKPINNHNFISRLNYIGREIKLYFTNKIDSIFSYDIDANALVKGILLGNKDTFTQDMLDNFSKTGISHIIAVSGLHLNILIGAICGIMGFFRIRRKYASLIIIPLILLFSSVIGFTPSVCRAGLMLTLNLIALLCKRQYDSLTSLFISALVILLFNPYLLFSVSFILSFVATLSIIIGYPVIIEKFKNGKKNKVNFVTGSFAVSLASFIGTAPFIAYYFKQVSFASLIANIWIIPLCSFVLVSGYICIFLSTVIPIQFLNFILYPLAACIEIIVKTTEISSSIVFSSVSLEHFRGYLIILYFLAIYIALWQDE